MISNIRFERDPGAGVTDEWLMYLHRILRTATGSVAMDSSVLDCALFAVYEYHGVVHGKHLEPIRGFKDKTPWKPMMVTADRIWTMDEVDPNGYFARPKYSGFVARCLVWFDDAQGIQIKSFGSLFDNGFLRSSTKMYQWANSFDETPEMKLICAQMEAEVQTIVPVLLDPQWWWSAKYLAEDLKLEVIEEKAEVIKKARAKYEKELVSRSMAVPV